MLPLQQAGALEEELPIIPGRTEEGKWDSLIVIEVNLSISTSWVLDTGCGSHICSNVEGLRNRRTLKEGEVDLRVGNEARVTALEIDDYSLSLPSGLVILLKNCYFVPAMSRNIISISCLDMDGFSFII